MSTHPQQLWRDEIQKALKRGEEDLLVMPEWIALSLRQWLDATKDQAVSLADFVAYVGAILGHPVQTFCTEETITADEILVWMPSSVSDAMSDLMADLRARRGLSVAEQFCADLKKEPTP